MSSQPVTYLTPEQYLEIERKAESRSEYLNGEMFAMPGASVRHNDIVVNTGTELRIQLRPAATCRVYITDLRLLIPSTGLYTYPDLMVICGPPQLSGGAPDIVTNPTFIGEVLSASTKDYDRGEKFLHYRSIPSFSEYLLIAQDTIRVEHYARQPDNSWVFREYTTAGIRIDLNSIGCALDIGSIYEGVEF